MSREKKIIQALVFLLLVSTSFTVYVLLSKKNTAAPVFLFMYDKQRRFLSEDSLSRPEFWDNYPYYVILSMHKSIHLEKYVVDEANKAVIERYLKMGNDVFYRFNHIVNNDSVYVQTLHAIAMSKKPITILTDKASFINLSTFIDTRKENIRVVEINSLPIYLEKPKLSYFFKVSKNNTVIDLYVPRRELPEVTNKYIRHVLSTNK